MSDSSRITLKRKICNPINYMEWIIARHNSYVVVCDFNEELFKEGVLSKFYSNCCRANSY